MNNIKVYNSESEYYEEHCCCPKCGSDDYASTYEGFVFIKGKSYKDENWCKCACGWSGIIDDLVGDDEK